MISNYKLGINLGWHEEDVDEQTIFNQYQKWLNTCQENNIKLVRIFLVRWSINALFKNNKLDLLLKIIKEAEGLGIEIILVLNHFTDFIDQHYRDLDEAKYTWNSYPLKKSNIKDFFNSLDQDLLSKVRKVLGKIKECKNINKIELFNELDLVGINNKILISWVNKLVEVLDKYQEKYKFYVSIANHNNLNLFRKNLSISVDVHFYNFPSEYAFKNIEYFKEKLGSSCYLGEYAKFSDNSHLGVCESKAWFCSGLWGSYLQGLNNSPLHWWWQELLVNNEYLKIISLFNQCMPEKFRLIKDSDFEITDLKIIEASNDNDIRKNKILFRLKNLILHPTLIKVEWGGIIKFIKKILFSYRDNEDVLMKKFEDKEYIYFYCETKNCQKVNFNLNTKIKTKMSSIEIINLLSGEIQQVDSYIQTNKILKLSCEFSSNHLIKIRKNPNV